MNPTARRRWCRTLFCVRRPPTIVLFRGAATQFDGWALQDWVLYNIIYVVYLIFISEKNKKKSRGKIACDNYEFY